MAMNIGVSMISSSGTETGGPKVMPSSEEN